MELPEVKSEQAIAFAYPVFLREALTALARQNGIAILEEFTTKAVASLGDDDPYPLSKIREIVTKQLNHDVSAVRKTLEGSSRARQGDPRHPDR